MSWVLPGEKGRYFQMTGVGTKYGNDKNMSGISQAQVTRQRVQIYDIERGLGERSIWG